MPGDFFCRQKPTPTSVTAAEKVSYEISDGRNAVSDGINRVSDVKKYTEKTRQEKTREEKTRAEQTRQEKTRGNERGARLKMLMMDDDGGIENFL